MGDNLQEGIMSFGVFTALLKFTTLTVLCSDLLVRVHCFIVLKLLFHPVNLVCLSIKDRGTVEVLYVDLVFLSSLFFIALVIHSLPFILSSDFLVSF